MGGRLTWPVIVCTGELVGNALSPAWIEGWECLGRDKREQEEDEEAGGHAGDG